MYNKLTIRLINLIKIKNNNILSRNYYCEKWIKEQDKIKIKEQINFNKVKILDGANINIKKQDNEIIIINIKKQDNKLNYNINISNN
jgi:hypothetical protein